MFTFSSSRILTWGLCATLLMSGVVAQEAASQVSESATQQRRELFSLWDLFMFIHPHGPCPPGPLGKHCHEEETTETEAEQEVDSSESVVSESSEASETTAGTGGGQQVKAGFAWWMIVAAASLISAMFAVNMGQRKNPVRAPTKHGLAGAVNRRVGAVSAFAAGALGGGAMAKADKDSGVELRPGYHMEAGPEGYEMKPGYELA